MKTFTKSCLIMAFSLSLFMAIPQKIFAETLCGVSKSTDEEARSFALDEVKSLTLKLKIANFRADVAYMKEIANLLEGRLRQCVSANSNLSSSEKRVERVRQLAKVCHYECYAQIAQYKLFMATDFKFLSQASAVTEAASMQHAATAAALADEGIFLLEEAATVISQQQPVTDGLSNEKKAANFNLYLKQSGMLQALKIRLYMAKGDVWYQSLSNLAVTRIAGDASASINPTLGSIAELCTPDNKMACALRYALDYYEQAFWLLIEAETDIPAGSQFVSEQMLLNEIRNDLSMRRSSLRNGYLFLNIDPDAFTQMSFAQLSAVLKPVIQKLNDLDAKIQVQITAWKAEQKEQGYSNIDTSRMLSEESINLSGHIVGALESAAQAKISALSVEKSKIDLETGLLQQKQALAQLKFELDKNLRQFEKEKSQIENRTQQELLALKKASLAETQSKLRWLINVEITEMNLSLQEEALNAQNIEYERQIASNQESIEDLVSANKQKLNAIASETENKSILQAKIANIKTEISRKSELKRETIRQNLCDIEREVSFIDPSKLSLLPKDTAIAKNCVSSTPAQNKATLFNKICGTGGLKEALSKTAIKGSLFKSVCIDGNQAPANAPLDLKVYCNNTDYVKATKDILDYKKKMADIKWQESKTQRDQLRSQLYELRKTQMTVNGLDSAILKLNALYIVSSTGESNKPLYGDLASVARAAVEIAQSAKQSYLIGNGIQQSISALYDKIDAMILEIESADLYKRYIAKEEDQTLLKLGYDADISDLATRSQIYEYDLSMTQCATQALDLSNEFQRLRLQYIQLTADYKTQELSDQQSTNDIAILKSQILQADLNIANLEAQIKDNERAKKAKDTDIARIQSLKDNTNRRLGTVTDTRDRVRDMETNYGQVFDQFNEINQQERDKVFALQQEDLNFLKSALKGEQTRTSVLTALETEIHKKLQAGLSIQFESSEVMAKAKAKIETESKKIIELSQNLSVQSNKDAKDKIFIATEADLSNLFPGVPDYINSKKSLINTANYTLNLIRSRYRRISGLGNEGFNPAIIKGDLGASAYITKTDQINEIDQTWTNNNLLNESPINIEKPVFVIPPNSRFSQELLTKGRVTFQISPRVRGRDFTETKTLMANAGYMNLWNPSLDNGNPRLVDAMVRISFGAGESCQDQTPNFTLVHKGFGYVFPSSGISASGESALPAIQVMPPVFASQAFLQPNQMSRYDRAKLIWDASPRVNTFDGENTGSDAARYIGLPVAATYELILHKHQCTYNGNGLEIFMAVATDTPK